MKIEEYIELSEAINFIARNIWGDEGINENSISALIDKEKDIWDDENIEIT